MIHGLDSYSFGFNYLFFVYSDIQLGHTGTAYC